MPSQNANAWLFNARYFCTCAFLTFMHQSQFRHIWIKKKNRWQLCGCGSSCLSLRIQSNQTAPEQLFLLTNTSMFSISNTNFDRWGHSVTRSLKTKFSGTLTPIQTLIRHSCQPEIWIDFILWYLLPNKLSVGICSSFSSPSYLDEKYSWKSRTRFFLYKKKEKKKQIISLCLPGETAAICIHYLAYRAESGNNAASILEIKPTAHEAWTF